MGKEIYLVILGFCLMASAIFSTAETALITLPETKIRKIIEEGKGFLRPFKLWLMKPNRVLTTIIIANNLFNTLAAVVATVLAQLLFAQHVISIATGTVTILLLIFGEITPKTFARHNAILVVRWVLYLIYPLYFLLFPIAWFLSWFAVLLVRLLGGKTQRAGPIATQEDIAYLIKLSHKEGVFKKEQGQMLQSIIAFKDTCAKEIMIPRTQILSFEINRDLNYILDKVTEHGYTRWPVYQKTIDHITGIFYVKDLIHQLQDNKQFILKEHLRKTIFVPESMKLDNILRELQRKKVHLAIVVDEYGGTAGIISLEDILEQIVGDIQDEYDVEDIYIKKLAHNHFIVDGKTTISELKKATGLSLPTQEAYETLGGFLVHSLGKLPVKDYTYHYHGYSLKVIEVEEKRVISVEIKKEQ